MVAVMFHNLSPRLSLASFSGLLFCTICLSSQEYTEIRPGNIHHVSEGVRREEKLVFRYVHTKHESEFLACQVVNQGYHWGRSHASLTCTH